MKEFVSPQKWFSLILPENWEPYEDEEGTHSFFNSSFWTGNLRVTPIRWENVNNEQKALDFINSEKRNNKKAKIVSLNGLYCLFFKELSNDDKDISAIYYWIVGKENTILICSFTTNENQSSFSEKFQDVELILGPIKIYD